MRFLHSERSLREHRVEPLLLHVERNQLFASYSYLLFIQTFRWNILHFLIFMIRYFSIELQKKLSINQLNKTALV